MRFEFSVINVHNGTTRQIALDFIDNDLHIYMDGKEIDNINRWPERDIQDLVFGEHKNYDIINIPKDEHARLKMLFMLRRL